MDLFQKLTSALSSSQAPPPLSVEQSENAEISSKTQEAERTQEGGPAKKIDPLKALVERHTPLLHAGDIVTGNIIGRGVATIFVNLGARGTGIIFGREFYQAQDVLRGLAKGDGISAKVVEPENDEGYTELSVKDAGREMIWQKIDTWRREGTVIKVKITAANRGGLIAHVDGMQAFIPVSQLSSAHYPRVEGGDKDKIYTELQKFMGQDLDVQVLDFAPQEEKFILSEKAIEMRELSELLKDYTLGGVITGTVSGVVDFGIFVRFGPDERLEGLAHISELDWQMVQNPSTLFAPGDKVQAKIIDIQNGKVSLSIKALKKDPWQDIAERFPKGTTLEGKVTKFSPFGAFVEITPTTQALIHISEFGTEARMKEALAIGQTALFRVASADPKEHRMSLKLASGEEDKKPEEQETLAPAPAASPEETKSDAAAPPQTVADAKTIPTEPHVVSETPSEETAQETIAPSEPA